MKNRKITAAGYTRKKEENLSFVVDNKKFWEVMKPLFNEKGSRLSNEKVVGKG